jgi:hypothetical protein
MNESRQARRFADKTTATVRDTMRQGSAAAEEMTQVARQGFFAAAAAVGDFNVKLTQMARGNAMAALNFAQQVANAKGPAEVATLWSSYARERFETLTDQSGELTALAQRVMTSTAEPLTHSFWPNAPR